jgi:hypothetical protein
MRAKRTRTSVQLYGPVVKAPGPVADAKDMQILFSNRRASWSRVAMDASGFAFAFALIALVAQSS